MMRRHRWISNILITHFTVVYSSAPVIAMAEGSTQASAVPLSNNGGGRRAVPSGKMSKKLMNSWWNWRLSMLIGVFLMVGLGCERSMKFPQSELYSPTLLTRLGDTYFLIDCWHNRILYSDEIHEDLLQWEVLDGDLAGPHSIDTDGHFYVVDDTGRHQLRVYVRDGDGFEMVQEIGDVGTRPHRVRYDSETESFYVIGSRSQTISRLVADGDELELKYTDELPFLEGRYTRSMSIIDGTMYFISGPGVIHQTYHRDDTYNILDSWEVPHPQREMNDIFKVGDQYFLTATHNWIDAEFDPENTIVQCQDLADFAAGECVDRKEELGLDGAPYYLSKIDGWIYVPQVFQYSGIVRFRLDENGDIRDIETLYDSGTPTPESKHERFRLPK